MPNWCLTRLTFAARDESKEALDAVKDLYTKIIKQYESETSLMDNGFGSSWLGNYYILFGIGNEESINNNKLICRCRGSIIDVEDMYAVCESDNINNFYIDAEDAWRPNVQIWNQIILKNYSDADGPLIDIYYQAEEPGCEVYVTNDSYGDFYTDKYSIDIQIPMIPNICKFYTQQKGSPFCKIDRDALDYGYIDNDCFYKCDYYDSDDDLLDLYNNVIFKEPVEFVNSDSTLQKLDAIRNKIYNESNNYYGYININEFELCNIDDIDPLI